MELPRPVYVVPCFPLDPAHERGQFLKDVRYLVKREIEAAEIHLTGGIAMSWARPRD